MSAACKHTDTFRGLDAPRRWGSDRTEVCSSCGMYRRKDHHDQVLAGWMPAVQYAEDTAKDENS